MSISRRPYTRLLSSDIALRLLVILLLALVVSCGSASVDSADFVGTWNNDNNANPVVTTMEITSDGLYLYVQMWEACASGECDMGILNTTAMDADDGELTLAREDATSITAYNLTLTGTNALELYSNTTYTDGSGLPNEELLESFGRPFFH